MDKIFVYIAFFNSYYLQNKYMLYITSLNLVAKLLSNK